MKHPGFARGELLVVEGDISRSTPHLSCITYNIRYGPQLRKSNISNVLSSLSMGKSWKAFLPHVIYMKVRDILCPPIGVNNTPILHKRWQKSYVSSWGNTWLSPGGVLVQITKDILLSGYYILFWLTCISHQVSSNDSHFSSSWVKCGCQKSF